MAFPSRSLRLLAPVVCLALTGLATASVVLSASIEELAAKSLAVVEVDVGDSRVRFEPDAGRIWTLTDVTTRATLHGEKREAWVVATPGGRVGNVEQAVSGSAKLRSGARMVLFLTEDGGGRHQVLGESAGAFTLHRRSGTDDWRARSDRGGLVLVDSAGERAPSVDADLSAEDLRKRVRRESRRIRLEAQAREARRKARAEAARERARERSRRRGDLPGVPPPRED